MYPCPIVSEYQYKSWSMPKTDILFSEVLLMLQCRVMISKRYSIRQRIRFSSHSCLFPSDQMYGRQGLHPCSALFAIFAHFTLSISHAKKRWETAGFAARATRSLCTIVSQFCHTARPWYVIYVVWEFQLPTCSGSGGRPSTLTPLHGGVQAGIQTGRKTHKRKTSSSLSAISPINLNAHVCDSVYRCDDLIGASK